MSSAKIVTENSFENRPCRSRFEFLTDHFKEGKILDIGNLGGVFGEGPSNSSHLLLKDKIRDTSTLYGFDLYEPKNKEEYPNQKQGDLEKELPYENDYFDTVYMGQILEHIKNPGSVLNEVKRILKQDGVLIIDVPNPYHLKRIVKYLLFRKEDLGDPTHLIFWTPASLKATLNSCGFEVNAMNTKTSGVLKTLPKPFRLGLGSHLLVAATRSS